MILRAPVSWLTALLASYSQGSGPLNYRIQATAAVDQQHTAGAALPPSAVVVPASQIISNPGNPNCWLIVPSAVVRALAGINAASMPGEALQLSAECCLDAQGGWGAALQTLLGFTTGFSPTLTPVPIMNC